MKYLVTGGAGFIGSHVVDALVKRGHLVDVFDNLSSGSLSNIKGHLSNKAEFIRGDLRNYHAVRKATKGVDAVIHLGACVGRSVETPRLDFETNAMGTLNVLKAGQEESVSRIVIASSVMVYSGIENKHAVKENDPAIPIIPYGASKVAAEAFSIAFHQTWDVPTVVLRYFNVYGPRSNPRNPYSGVVSNFLGRALKALPPMIYGNGRQARDFVFVDDVVAATVSATEQKRAIGEIINVGSGKATSILRLANLVLNTCGLKGKKLVWEPPRPNEYYRLSADITKAKELLGYNPKTNLPKGIKITWKFLKDNQR